MQGRCPFHESQSGKSFSVHLASGGFYCFGCEAKGGDVVDFIRLREKCNFRIAAQRLGAWKNVGETDRRAIAQANAERERKQSQEANLKRLAHDHRIQLRDEIHTTRRIQRETSSRLCELLQGHRPADEAEIECCWAVLGVALDDLRLTENEYMKASGLEHAG